MQCRPTSDYIMLHTDLCWPTSDYFMFLILLILPSVDVIKYMAIMVKHIISVLCKIRYNVYHMIIAIPLAILLAIFLEGIKEIAYWTSSGQSVLCDPADFQLANGKIFSLCLTGSHWVAIGERGNAIQA